MKLNEVKEKIEEIRNRDFKTQAFKCWDKTYQVCTLLRSTLICNNAIGGIDNISKVETAELYQDLDNVMKNKFKILNPNFSEKILNDMIGSYQRGYIIYPMDIFVIDDAVFHKEGVLDDFGNIYKMKTFMFGNMKEGYHEVSSIGFKLDDSDEIDFLPHQNNKRLTIEEDIYTSKFISDNINLIYNQNVTKPLYELNTEHQFYGYSGLVSKGAGVYINMKFADIGRSIKGKEECDLKICVQNRDDLMLFYVHQSFKDDKPVWSVVKTTNEVWRLTEEVLKRENEIPNATLKLAKN